MKKTVLFLCTGNTSRSQMAEAITNAFHGERWAALSAGTEPGSRVHPLALQVLQEIGIHHQGTPQGTASFRDRNLDLVVTVCDGANEHCPVWLGQGRKIHQGFEDPAAAEGTEEEILGVFRKVRDQIREQIPRILDRIDKGEV